MNSHSFDCIVVGKGLVGSAAAKYLQSTFKKVAVIGPDEPALPNEALVFASHYDQGRVQRIVGFDEVWTQLNKQSVDRYPKMVHQTGVNFHEGVGCLYVSPKGKDNYLEALPQLAGKFRTAYQFFENGDLIHRAFPDYQFPSEAFGAFESGPAGHINPLLLIKAQLSLFASGGGTVLNETALKIEKKQNGYNVKTHEGNSYAAPRVLVTAGAFSNFMGLLPRPLDLFLKSETVLLAQVSKEEADRLANLPSLLYEIDTHEVEGVYAIRPVKYPDGNYYLKMGCNLHTDILFADLKDIQEWFRSGDSNSNLDLLKDTLHSLMPRLIVNEYKTKRCIISRTKHRNMYIGCIDNNQLYVAAGGNGYAAMCSDALGNVAAHVTLYGAAPSDYPADSFNLMFAS